jgi:hypothetical protein
MDAAEQWEPDEARASRTAIQGHEPPRHLKASAAEVPPKADTKAARHRGS